MRWVKRNRSPPLRSLCRVLCTFGVAPEEKIILQQTPPSHSMHTSTDRRSRYSSHSQRPRATRAAALPLGSVWSREARPRASGRWSDRKSDEPPSVVYVLRPERGTAILYGGTVPHAGMPVLHGCRASFLASFSTKRNDLASHPSSPHKRTTPGPKSHSVRVPVAQRPRPRSAATETGWPRQP